MIRQNLHMHSRFDDGRDPCMAMLSACEARGMTSAGVSLHSPLPFPNDWTPEDTGPFLAEMRALKAAFAGRMRVYAGLELDVCSFGYVDPGPFEYVIGAAHHLPVSDPPPAVDESPETTAETLEACFGGDADAMAEAYYAETARIAEYREADVCAHFDLLTKFDERRRFFNPESGRYVRAASRAMDALIAAGKIFEVNTGAISRGWRREPYPARALLLEIKRRGGRVTVSSDAHAAEAVACAFDAAERLLLSCGFTEIWQLEDGAGGGKPAFRPVPLTPA